MIINCTLKLRYGNRDDAKCSDALQALHSIVMMRYMQLTAALICPLCVSQFHNTLRLIIMV